jgi:hypothetical protein
MSGTKQIQRDMYSQLRGCERKVTYSDKATAARTGQHVYFCRYCTKWHRGGKLVQMRNPVIRPDMFDKILRQRKNS